MTNINGKMTYFWRITRMVVCLSLALSPIVLHSRAAFGEDTEIFQQTFLEPNVLIIFDTSGSMLNVLPVDGFDPLTDYSTSLLSQGKTVVFAREAASCNPDSHRVTYQTDDGKVKLRYRNYTQSTDICSGTRHYETQWSNADKTFYFDRLSGSFITRSEFDVLNSNHVNVFLPYAAYSVDVDDTGQYSTRYEYNYLNWIFYHSNQDQRDGLKAMYDDPAKRDLLTRILVAKKAVKGLIDENLGVRFGIMRFDGSTGGRIKADIPSNNRALHASIDELWPGGYTPLSEALEDAWDYFGDEDSFNVDHWCRKNAVILMTDGLPTLDGNDLSDYIKKDWDGDSGGTEANGWAGNEDDLYAGEGSGYLDDVACYMQQNDARPDLQGIQNVRTYTIGFTIRNRLLEDTAFNGGGSYHLADNPDELSTAFHRIIEEILQASNSYAAPVVPIGQMEKTTSGSKVYLALFKPTLDAFWGGNNKRFGIATADDAALGIKKGDVLDANGSRATDPSGIIYETAVSHWGGHTPDGGETGRGGVGGVLLNRVEPRNIYTCVNKENSLTHPSNAFTIDNDELTLAMLEAADDAEREKIIDYIHGSDAYDDDRDSDTNERRPWILGAFLHSRPELVCYDSDTAVVFAGANDGMLHAFDDSNGEELWAFVPPDLLGKLKNLSGNRFAYFVDGSPRAYVIDNDHDGTIETGEEDRVILVFGERRGGNHFYGLDVSVPTAPDVLWSIGPDAPDFSELGQSWCTPVFGRIAHDRKPVVFLGGGYDLNQDSNPVTFEDTMGRGIYIVELLTGRLVWKWTHSDDPNMGWSVPGNLAALDTTDNGFIDRVYIGDMGGRLWRLDIGGLDPARWTAEILFNANSPADEGRKIFGRPDVTLEEGHELVFFGTGDRAHPKDETVINRIYAVKDRNTGQSLDESSLVDVTLDRLQDPSTPGGEKTIIRNNLANGNGWYIRLEDSLGEKVLSPPLVFARAAYFTTFIPTPAPVDDPCIMEKGKARLYALDYRTGEAVLNYNTANDLVGAEILEVSDRSLDIGRSIPSGLVIALIQGRASAYIGMGGGILTPEIGAGTPIIGIFWRQLF